jgi:hypothetical protein
MQSFNLSQQVNVADEFSTCLSEEDLDSVVGGFGWDDIKKGYDKVSGGVKRFSEGLKDGTAPSPSRHNDLWYNLGYGGPRLR